MRRWRLLGALVALLVGGCAADPGRHDFSGGFAGVSVAPTAGVAAFRP